MKTEVVWQPSFATSCLHSLEGVLAGRPVVDPRIADLLADQATRWRGELASMGLPTTRFWRNLLGLSSTVAGSRQLIETAFAKTVGRGANFRVSIDKLTSLLSELLHQFREASPNLTDELALRERPLREQWEARGPGMLAVLAGLTDEQLLPPAATVVLVHPTFGGGGEAHLAYNNVRIEALLANPHADLPEVVRLAWLIGQLQLDLPALGEQVHADRLPLVARCAVLPAILQAAEAVDLVRFSPELVGKAIDAWQIVAPNPLDLAPLVFDWWQTYQHDRPPLPIALEALDQMFAA